MTELNKIADELEALQIEHSRRLWVMYTTGFDLNVIEAQEKINTLLKDKEKYQIILKSLEKDHSTPEGRAAKILHNLFKKFHFSEKTAAIYEKIEKLEVKLANVINKHRCIMDGKTVDGTQIKNILDSEPDREMRKSTFLARAQINRPLVEQGFLDLVKLRKEFADVCGYKNFVEFRLDADELNSTIFADWYERTKAGKANFQQKKKQWAQKILNEDDLMPWDFAYVASKICPANKTKVDIQNFFAPIEKTFAAYGFDIANLNLTYDVFPRKNKSEWGYNFTIHPGKDSRVLANVANTYDNFNVLLHETAHGVHFLNLNPEEKIFNLGVSGIVAEGFANFFGELIYSDIFQSQFFNQDVQTIAKQFQDFKNFNKLNRTTAVRDILFDQQLYLQDLKSLEDIHELNWNLSRDFLGLEPYGDEPVWGFKVHHTVVPIYLHNYLLGDLMCESMQETFKNRFGQSAEQSPMEFGKFWREEVLQLSGRLPLLDLYKKVAGKDLNLGSFLS